jgi:hypothetical protein
MYQLKKAIGNLVSLNRNDVVESIVGGICLRKCKCARDEPVSRINVSYHQAGASCSARGDILFGKIAVYG